MFAFAMFMSFCVDIIVMSSEYVVSFTVACGVGVSHVYMLNNIGDTQPCGHQFGIGVVLLFCFCM